MKNIKDWKSFNENIYGHRPIMGTYKEWLDANEEGLKEEYAEYIKEMEFEGFGEDVESFEDWSKLKYNEIVNI